MTPSDSIAKWFLSVYVLQARVEKIHINGLDRTKDDYIQRACKKLFAAQTFQDVLQETNE